MVILVWSLWSAWFCFTFCKILLFRGKWVKAYVKTTRSLFCVTLDRPFWISLPTISIHLYHSNFEIPNPLPNQSPLGCTILRWKFCKTRGNPRFPCWLKPYSTFRHPTAFSINKTMLLCCLTVNEWRWKFDVASWTSLLPVWLPSVLAHFCKISTLLLTSILPLTWCSPTLTWSIWAFY